MQNENHNEIADILKKARINAGYATAKEFAQKNNLPIATYYQHESGKRIPKLNSIQHYCYLLNVNMELFAEQIYKQGIRQDHNIGSNKPILTKKKMLMSANTRIYQQNKPLQTGQNKDMFEEMRQKLTKLLNKNNTQLDSKQVFNTCMEIYGKIMSVSADNKLQIEFMRILISILNFILKPIKE